MVQHLPGRKVADIYREANRLDMSFEKRPTAWMRKVYSKDDIQVINLPVTERVVIAMPGDQKISLTRADAIALGRQIIDITNSIP